MLGWFYNWWNGGYRAIAPGVVVEIKDTTPEIDEAVKIRATGNIPVYIITEHPEIKTHVFSIPTYGRAGYLMQQIKKQNSVKSLNQRNWGLYQNKKYITPNTVIAGLDNSKIGYVFLTLATY